MAIQGTTFFNIIASYQNNGSYVTVENVQGGHNGLPHKLKRGIAEEFLPFSSFQDDVVFSEYHPVQGGSHFNREAVNAVTAYSVGGWAARWSGIDSDDYHIVYINSSGDVYHCIATVTDIDTLRVPTYSTPVLVFNGTSGAVGSMRVNVCLSTSGYIYVEGHIDGTAERFFYVSTDGGATFSTTGVNIHENVSGDKAVMCPAWGSGDGNDIMFAYVDKGFTTSDLTIKFFDHSAGTVTETGVDTGVDTGTFSSQTQNQISFISDPDAQKNYLAYWKLPDTATTDLRFWEIDYNSATQKTDVTPSSGGNQGAAGISIEASTGDIYVVYAGKDDGTSEYDTDLIDLDLMYKFSKDGGTTWSAERTLIQKNISGSTDAFKFLLVCPYIPSGRFEYDPPVYVLTTTGGEYYEVKVERIAVRRSYPDQLYNIRQAQKVYNGVSYGSSPLAHGCDAHFIVEDWTTGNIIMFSKGEEWGNIFASVSVDGGLSWALYKISPQGYVVHLSVWYDRWSGIADDKVHISIVNSATDDTYYVQYDFSTNIFSTEVSIFNGTTGANNVGRSYIVKTEDGVLHAAGYNDDTTQNYSYYSTDNGATWTSTSNTAQLAGADDYTIALPALGSATDDYVGIQYDSSAGTLDIKYIDVSAPSSSTTSIATGLGTVLQTATNPVNIGVALDRTNDLIYVAYSDALGTGGDIQIKEIDVSSGTPSITTRTAISNIIGTSYVFAALTIDDNGVLYCFAGEGTVGGTVDLHEWQSSDAGVTWKFIRIVDQYAARKLITSSPVLNGTNYGTPSNPFIPAVLHMNTSNGATMCTYLDGYISNEGSKATNW